MRVINALRLHAASLSFNHVTSFSFNQTSNIATSRTIDSGGFELGAPHVQTGLGGSSSALDDIGQIDSLDLRARQASAEPRELSEVKHVREIKIQSLGKEGESVPVEVCGNLAGNECQGGVRESLRVRLVTRQEWFDPAFSVMNRVLVGEVVAEVTMNQQAKQTGPLHVHVQ